MGRAGGTQQCRIGFLIAAPLLAHLQVARIELPAFGGVVNTFLQTIPLLVKTDVQHEFHDHRAGLNQHLLERVDLSKTQLDLSRFDPAVYHGYEHVFVVAAVEDHKLACSRYMLMNAPQIIARQLRRGGRFPAHGMHAQGCGTAEYAADCAVFAGCVCALQHHQQLEAAVGVKQVLQSIQLNRQRFDCRFIAGFVARGERFF